MTDDELRDALDGLYAYDGGATDSGIRDENLRARCKEELKARHAGDGYGPWLSRLVREMWLSDEAIEQGYGIVDAVEFCRWLDEEMGVALW